MTGEVGVDPHAGAVTPQRRSDSESSPPGAGCHMTDVVTEREREYRELTQLREAN